MGTIRRTKQAAQALVEWALAILLIFFLLSAAVDLGLIFFARQQMINASAEGASYGTRFIDDSDAGNLVQLRIGDIRRRILAEATERGGIGSVNLHDLDANGQDDIQEMRDAGMSQTEIDACLAAPNDRDGTSGCIFAQRVWVELRATDDYAQTDPPCPRVASNQCFLFITVNGQYRPIFPLAPALGATVPISVRTSMQMRPGIEQVGGPTLTPEVVTVTPTNPPPTATEVPPTSTPVPPTRTNTPGPTATPVTPTRTNTPRPPTATPTNLPAPNCTRISAGSASLTTSSGRYSGFSFTINNTNGFPVALTSARMTWPGSSNGKNRFDWFKLGSTTVYEPNNQNTEKATPVQWTAGPIITVPGNSNSSKFEVRFQNLDGPGIQGSYQVTLVFGGTANCTVNVPVNVAAPTATPTRPTATATRTVPTATPAPTKSPTPVTPTATRTNTPIPQPTATPTPLPPLNVRITNPVAGANTNLTASQTNFSAQAWVGPSGTVNDGNQINRVEFRVIDSTNNSQVHGYADYSKANYCAFTDAGASACKNSNQVLNGGQTPWSVMVTGRTYILRVTAYDNFGRSQTVEITFTVNKAGSQ